MPPVTSIRVKLIGKYTGNRDKARYVLILVPDRECFRYCCLDDTTEGMSLGRSKEGHNSSICGCQWQGQLSSALFALSMKKLLNLSLISHSEAFPQEALAANCKAVLSAFQKVYALCQEQAQPFI